MTEEGKKEEERRGTDWDEEKFDLALPDIMSLCNPHQLPLHAFNMSQGFGKYLEFRPIMPAHVCF
jgi:hypothetical protein